MCMTQLSVDPLFKAIVKECVFCKKIKKNLWSSELERWKEHNFWQLPITVSCLFEGNIHWNTKSALSAWNRLSK